VTLAHLGALLLDEAAEFGAEKLDLLREPLGSGEISLARLGDAVRFPARVQLVATTNPCPCGWYGSAVRPCRCLESEVARYRRRLSGPLRDRIDLWVDTDREPAGRFWDAGSDPAPLRIEVAAARGRALARGSINALLEGERLHRACALTARARGLAQRAADGMGLSVRAMTSALRVARTIADLDARDRVDEPDLAEALQFRRP
jgi:magnesium chelatase family protein